MKNPDAVAIYNAETPLGRVGQPEEVASEPHSAYGLQDQSL